MAGILVRRVARPPRGAAAAAAARPQPPRLSAALGQLSLKGVCGGTPHASLDCAGILEDATAQPDPGQKP
jgi:hypothetical protein